VLSPFRSSSGLQPAVKGQQNQGALAPGLSLAEAIRPFSPPSSALAVPAATTNNEARTTNNESVTLNAVAAVAQPASTPPKRRLPHPSRPSPLQPSIMVS
jgi:hypothetical protein